MRKTTLLLAAILMGSCQKPVSPPSLSSAIETVPFENGDHVLIYHEDSRTALSQAYDGYYNKGIPLSDDLFGYSRQEVWTLEKASEDTWHILSENGEALSLGEEYSSMPLDGPYTEWVIEPLEEDSWTITNPDRKLTIEWYAKQSRWTAYTFDPDDPYWFCMQMAVIPDEQYGRLPEEAAVKPSAQPASVTETEDLSSITEDGQYQTKDAVAYYIYTYHHLPDNYMTKSQARKYGWESGPLYRIVEGRSIGGDTYGNYEETLPVIDGKYIECDIDTLGKKSRGAKRIVYDDSFNVYYTEDHYETFEKLYPKE
ncbi:MAG: hypothetical protein IKD69_11550 [Solobacterium sp.]|nr:hypothetical protein [Solobacterium sp.]